MAEPDESDETVTELEIVEPALPGTTAAEFRDSLRTTFLVVGMPVFMFGLVLDLWGPWLTVFFASMLALMVIVDVLRRGRRLRALRERGELP